MKRINKFALFILGALSFASCSDINDIESEGYRITGEQIDDATSVIPSRVEAKIAGMYSSMGTVCAAFPSDTRDDDGGYPTVCLSQDLNGPDMICANNGYNWFSVSSEYSDRYATYANPFARYAIFYNQIKAANDIILSIDPATASETEKYYLGQAKAVRAFDYLCLAPYYQFRYATSKDLPCVPLITEETTNFVNNPRATVGKVYEQIISDLNSAIDLLEGYNRQGDKTRIDQQVAYGLRARAHLYMGMWQEAYNDADKAMEGYTPYTKEEVSKPAFYDISDHNWMWVSNPNRGGGLHNYGLAVDINIQDSLGQPLPMGTKVDHLGIEAHITQESELVRNGKISEAERQNRILLRRVMKEAGFRALPSEWWHFNFCSRDVARQKYKVIP